MIAAMISYEATRIAIGRRYEDAWLARLQWCVINTEIDRACG